MAHTLDENRLDVIFDGLLENTDKLTTWECDRLDEWHSMWQRGRKLSEKQLEILESMWVKV